MAGRTLPVLLIIFNRPETTRQVFDAIRDYAPKALYIAGDGSRGTVWDDIRIQAAREVVRGVDWSCDIHHYYRDDNAGCRVNVLEAVSWFFANVDEGIILEDDVVPTPAFFSFCEAGLNHFRFDPRVAAIGGFTAHQPGAPYLSVHGSVWGWASWSAVWNSVLDPGAQINEYDLTAVLSVASIWTTLEKITIRERFSRATIDTWDYTWLFSRIRKRKLMLLPGGPLINNIGFGVEATHTHTGRRPRRARQVPPAWIDVRRIDSSSQSLRRHDSQRIRTRHNFGILRIAATAFLHSPLEVAQICFAHFCRFVRGSRRHVRQWGLIS